MDCIFIAEARYLHHFKIWIRFSNGESGEVDLENMIYKYQAAITLRNPTNFANFFLDSWPTLAWDCGFDVAPEYLYELATGKIPASIESV
jgi:hypothetical protein